MYIYICVYIYIISTPKILYAHTPTTPSSAFSSSVGHRQPNRQPNSCLQLDPPVCATTKSSSLPVYIDLQYYVCFMSRLLSAISLYTHLVFSYTFL